MMLPQILPGAEPVYFPGGKVGCLVLHGVTASPQEVYWLAEYLSQQGYTVCLPRHFGHGLVDRHTIKRARWQDWYLSALDAYHLLRRNCDQVFVMGLSMGGLISLLLASALPVDGVAALAAPLFINAKNQWLAHILRHFGVRVAKFDQSVDPVDQRIREMQRDRGEPETGRVAYYEHTASGVAELFLLQKVVMQHLGAVTAPALLIYSEKDSAVPFGNLSLLERNLSRSRAITTLPLKQSDHIITNDLEHQQVFEAVGAFVKQYSGSSSA
ncbi:MAG: alpha/beta fold hydrolase [Anaerolinea sp.]|nr:alpha/beta fold hydrolase [Anaerolinea sp.]MCC6975295.1 alpha/beta fold hydrolase [Anaerolineae bacterium]